MKSPAIVVDLDGTLCDVSHRQHHVGGQWGAKEFKEFYEKMDDDSPYEWCRKMVQLYLKDGYKVIFVTGRPDEYRQRTVKWLYDRCGLLPNSHYELHMRPTGNFECDTINKKKIYDEMIVQRHAVSFVLEDRNKVVSMWRQLGLPCLQVQEGDF